MLSCSCHEKEVIMARFSYIISTKIKLHHIHKTQSLVPRDAQVRVVIMVAIAA